jgi:hypothetical protein
MASTVGIVLINKMVYQTFAFKFPLALSWLHILFTAAGMQLMARAGGIFEPRSIPFRDQLLLGGAFVGYVVFGNLSLQVSGRVPSFWGISGKSFP